MRTWNASTRAELDAALDAASGGDKIVLSPGQYGSLNLKNVEFDDFVTITSADPDNEARFTGIQVSGSEYIRFDDIHVDSPSNGSSGGGFVYIRDESSHIQIINSEINGSVDNVFEGGFGVRVKDASDIVFSNNYIHDVNHGVSFFSVDDLVVSENYFDRVMSDSMKFGGVSGALIENNWGAQFFDATPDAHVDFIQFQASATDTIIRGNVLLGQEYDGGKVYQGIFMSGGGVYKNVLVENNIIHTNTVNGILMNAAPGSDDVVIQNNTVISDVEDSKWDKATIRIVEFDGTMTVRNNVADDFWLGGASDLKQSGNVQVQFLDPSKANHYDNYFANATKSGTVTLEDLVPVAGSGIEFGSGVGAEQRLAELLDGDGSYGTPPDPLPIDEVPGTGDSGAGSDDDGETGDSSGSDAPPPPPPPPPAPEPDPEPEPPAAESPAPEPPAPEEPDDQTDGAYGTLYALNRKIDVRGKSDVIVIEHTSKMEVDSANIAFTFVADKVNGTRGLISKDASDYDGGGHHFSTYIKKGELFVRAQDKDSSETINLGEVEVGEEYSVKVAFGDGVVSASLNEAPAIEVDFEMDWTYNVQDLQIGALGWASKSGDSAFRNTFDGEIYDLSITTGEEDDGSTPGDQPPDSGSGVPGLVYSLDG
ncbi:MAG: right-handed parallel beta-helix repeat-containing protein, partial [Pseudomonadota bacterium]